MSHQSNVVTKLKSLEAFEKVAVKMGCKTRRDAQWRIYGGMSQRPADLVIELPRNNYDVAVLKAADGSYRLSSDFYELNNDHNFVNAFGENGELIVQAAVVEDLREFHHLDFTTDQTTLADGSVQLEFTSLGS